MRAHAHMDAHTHKMMNIMSLLVAMTTLNYLHKFFQLVEAEPEVGHGGFEQLPQFIVVHELHQHTERLLLRHLVAIMMLHSHKMAVVV